jgi:hypothetical protein
MISFPQNGRCLCGDLEYRLIEDPLTVYLCHCTDCQTQSGTSFATSMIVRDDAFEILRGPVDVVEIELDDGRVRHSQHCRRCRVRVGGPSGADGFAVIEPGTLDDTSWFRPVGHIWTRSAQPWFEIPADTILARGSPMKGPGRRHIRCGTHYRALSGSVHSVSWPTEETRTRRIVVWVSKSVS